MIEFALGRYDDGWRLVKWDGNTEAEIETGRDTKPTLDECLSTLMTHHQTGNQPFSSQEGTIDSLLLSNQWPLPTRDMTLSDETVPWAD